jgi:APA family basic amino acid/polyamine antiporter
MYAWPDHAHAVAVGAVVALTAVNYGGVRKSALLTRIIVAVVIAVLAALTIAAFTAGAPQWPRLAPSTGAGVLQAAGLLFFAFAGYARIATLGEEVRDPARTIPKAIPLALGITLVVYAAVAVAALTVLGPQRLAAATAPLTELAHATGFPAPVVRAGAAVAALGSLLALILGVSRTTLAMARDGHLPRALAAVHPRFAVPHRAELAVGVVVAVVAATADLRAVIGFSSFGVLLYYAVANASAWTLTSEENRPPRVVPVLGFAGCLVLACSLPLPSVLTGAAVVAVGGAVYAIRGPAPESPV